MDELPLAPESDRVDLALPTFSNPTKVTNPLFPIADLPSAILAGRFEGKPFKTGPRCSRTRGSSSGQRAWEGLRASDVPPRLEARMNRALEELTRAVAERSSASAAPAAVSVAQAGLDLALRYAPSRGDRPLTPRAVVRQLQVDAARGDAGAVRGDLATLEPVR